MKIIEGNIVDVIARRIYKGRIFYSDKIHKIEEIELADSDNYIIPGLIDAHVHIESSMLTPLEYSKIATKHGVVGAVIDPHEIANVCGMEGIQFMVASVKQTPMKVAVGAPSCVPATGAETSGAVISSKQLEDLFVSETCSHLSEMMNFPGVVNEETEVLAKLEIAKKYGRIIDGHAPLLSGYDLRKYVRSGIITDHECTSVHEALEKISLGMKIMLRNSSASKDFRNLISFIKTHPEMVMLCTDDCHPDELEQGYLNLMVKEALGKGYDIFDVLQVATKSANDLYNLNVGLLQDGDPADFVLVNNLIDFDIQSTFIEGREVFNKEKGSLITASNNGIINQFFRNKLSVEDILVKKIAAGINVIQVIENSLLTRKIPIRIAGRGSFIETDTANDILKIVVVNRYTKAEPSVGFIKGFGLKKGAFASSIAHDSHNIVAVGVNDVDLVSAIQEIQDVKGGLSVVDGKNVHLLSLPIAGLMSDKSCSEVATHYKAISKIVKDLGCVLHAPFMTLAFMSLLVIPELKIGDKGLFDVNLFDFIELQF